MIVGDLIEAIVGDLIEATAVDALDISLEDNMSGFPLLSRSKERELENYRRPIDRS